MNSQNKEIVLQRFRSLSKWVIDAWPLLPAAMYLIGFLILVLFYLLRLSFSTIEVADSFPTFQPFIELLKGDAFHEALISTSLFVLVGTPLELLAGLFLALLLYKSFFMRNFIRSVFLIPLAIPALVTATLLFILFDYPGGHVNHLLSGNYPPFPSVISSPISWRGAKIFALGVSLFGKVWRDMPISMLIILAGLNSLDPQLFDAAKTMGANARHRLQYIIIPLIIPSISAVVLLRSVEMWKEFIFPFVLAGRYHLLGTLIDFFYNDIGNANQAARVAVGLVVCIVVTTFLFLKAMELLQKFLLKQ